MEVKQLAPEFLRIRDVMAVTGLSRASIYRLGQMPGSPFPKPVKLSERASAWVRTEVEDWAQAKIANRAA